MIEEANSKQRFRNLLKQYCEATKKAKPGQDSVSPRYMVLTINVNAAAMAFLQTSHSVWGGSFFQKKSTCLIFLPYEWVVCFVHSAKLYAWCSVTSFLFVPSSFQPLQPLFCEMKLSKQPSYNHTPHHPKKENKTTNQAKKPQTKCAFCGNVTR